jgi:virginiamycin B lyase
MSDRVDGTLLRAAAVAFAALAVAVLAFAARADALVYWANAGSDTIGRANLDGTGTDQSFITGARSPEGVAVDAAHVYWTNSTIGTIGRANLDGTGIDQSFITGASGPIGVAVDGAHAYWTNIDAPPLGGNAIGTADLANANADQNFISLATAA